MNTDILDAPRPMLRLQEQAPAHFQTPPDLNALAADKDRTRVFEGTGVNFIEVPGCLGIERVMLNYQEIPMAEKRHYLVSPHPAPGGTTQEVSEPMYALLRSADGVPILSRSPLSNDGIWQQSAKIFITGEWDESEGTVADEPDEGAVTRRRRVPAVA